MSAALIFLIVLSAGVGVACLLGGVWVLRSLRWEVVDDDQLHERISRKGGSGRSWLKAWLKPKTRLLTYRRDERGRFRRYRR